MKKTQIRSGLTVSQRTILAKLQRILPPKTGKNNKLYHRVLWSIYDPQCDDVVTGYTDVVEGYRNSAGWNAWMLGAAANSIWAVVVNDDLNRSRPDWICIDADHAPQSIEELV